MDKYILHSLLQDKVTKGSTVDIKFRDPFVSYSGKYLVNESKTGRGRGGSRVIEIQAVDSGLKLTSFSVDGKDKLIGTAVSEYFESITIDGMTHADLSDTESGKSMRKAVGDVNVGSKAIRNSSIRSLAVELAPSHVIASRAAKPNKRTIVANRARRGLVTPAEKLANSLKDLLTAGTATVIRLQAFSANSPMNGDWVVNEYEFTDEDKLVMQLTDIDNPTRSFAFNASSHAQQVREIDIVNDVV